MLVILVSVAHTGSYKDSGRARRTDLIILICLILPLFSAYTFIMDDTAALTYQLEYIFLKKLIDELRNETISVEESKADAGAFLDIEPFTTPEETYIKIMEFVKQHSKFTVLKDYMNAYQKEKQDRAKIAQMREHLKKNDIDAALAVAKA